MILECSGMDITTQNVSLYNNAAHKCREYIELKFIEK